MRIEERIPARVALSKKNTAGGVLARCLPPGTNRVLGTLRLCLLVWLVCRLRHVLDVAYPRLLYFYSLRDNV